MDELLAAMPSDIEVGYRLRCGQTYARVTGHAALRRMGESSAALPSDI